MSDGIKSFLILGDKDNETYKVLAELLNNLNQEDVKVILRDKTSVSEVILRQTPVTTNPIQPSKVNVNIEIFKKIPACAKDQYEIMNIIIGTLFFGDRVIWTPKLENDKECFSVVVIPLTDTYRYYLLNVTDNTSTFIADIPITKE